MRLAEITLFILVILLTFSVGINVFLYTGKRPDPVPEIVTVSDTVVRVDTIIHNVTQQVTIDRPVPVYIDTTANIRTYRDTIYLPYGTIRGEQVVIGELLRKDIQVDFRIPEVYRTLEVNNSVTRSVKKRMLLGTIGMRTDFNHNSTVVFGVAYFSSNHRYIFEIDYGIDRQISAKVGFAIQK